MPIARALEFATLFFVLPLASDFGWLPVHPFVALWLLAAVCACVLLASKSFDRRRWWSTEELARHLGRASLPFLVAAPLLLVATALYAPENLFAFVRQRPLLWAAVMVLYPLLSVVPQGILFRDFVFHRYRAIFPGRTAVILASALAFSFAHIVFHNWVAPVLSLFGGLLFAWTYERTRSALVASAQHALFGCYLFTIGLGWYFYYGSVGR